MSQAFNEKEKAESRKRRTFLKKFIQLCTQFLP
jgi:hypothetical protein